MDDPFDLARFVGAQTGSYERALGELRAGAKTSHWMWYVFPQLAGLGQSAMAQHFAIRGLGEARAYLAHPVLGPRLVECTAAMLAHRSVGARQIFGTPDDLKFRSSITLFARAAADPAPFVAALDRYFGGSEDPRTLALLA